MNFIYGIFVLAAILATATCDTATMNNNLDEFNKAILETHIKLRRKHQAFGDFVLNEKLSQDAQKEALRKLESYKNNMTFTANPEDVDDRNYNDNTWAYVSFAKRGWNAKLAKNVTLEWLAEEQRHNWSDNYFSVPTGHFTQMIWQSTEEIGIGVADGRMGNKQHIKVAVIRYSPPGNILDRDTFAENVLPSVESITTPKPQA